MASPERDPLTTLDYYRTIEFEAMLGGQTLRVVSKPGLPQWDEVTWATRLLTEHAGPADDARVLVLGCGHGAGAASLAARAAKGSVIAMDTHVAALEMATRTARVNGLSNVEVVSWIALPEERHGCFDLVLMDVPPNRKLARRWLFEAFDALRSGGVLLLAGANDAGIQPVIEDASTLFGAATVVGYKAKHRIARAVKGPVTDSPPWAREPGIAPDSALSFDVVVGDQQLRLQSLPGVFSHGRLDEGTRLLLEHLEVPAGGCVLDVGCGYGIIGALAALKGAERVDLIDANLLAVASAKSNLETLSLDQGRALPSDALAAVHAERYDLVVTNPPFHAGKQLTYDVAQTFIEHGRYLLRAGGALMLVANRFIPYDHLMRPLFRTVDRVAETASFQVLRGR
jgi:16S rRNA (guanine1207-N2)-methyltransferase